MPRISGFLPIPGVSEVQDLIEGFSRRLKDADLAHHTRAVLTRRLESLTELATELDNLSELQTQLREIEQEFQLTETSSPRLKLLYAPRRQKAWENLKTRLNLIMEMTSLKLLTQIRRAQVEQIGTQLREPKANIIESYEVVHQAELPKLFWPRDLPDLIDRRPKDIKTSLRAGKFGDLSVVYKTFVADSKTAAHEIVGGEMEHISQSLHFNVATLVGATQGYNGLNGIILTMDGVDFAEFARKSHSGAVWAQCIRGFEAFIESTLKWKRAQRVTVAPSGHVTVLPSIFYRKSFQGMVVEFLGLGFTELQVMRIASSCKLLPLSRGQHLETIRRAPFQPEVGGFGHITDRRGKYIAWESLGASRQIRRTDLDNSTQAGAFRLTWRNTLTSDGKRWLSFTLRIPSPNPIPRGETSYSWSYRQDLKAPARSRWADILAEAHEMAERLQIDVDSITFYYRNITKINLVRPGSASWDELPTTFYYHRPLDSFNLGPAAGFISTSGAPDTDAWHKGLKQRGWKVSYKMKIGTLDMCDDWGLQYERELKRSMETMPGSYLGARIEEII